MFSKLQILSHIFQFVLNLQDFESQQVQADDAALKQDHSDCESPQDPPVADEIVHRDESHESLDPEGEAEVESDVENCCDGNLETNAKHQEDSKVESENVETRDVSTASVEINYALPSDEAIDVQIEKFDRELDELMESPVDEERVEELEREHPFRVLLTHTDGGAVRHHVWFQRTLACLRQESERQCPFRALLTRIDRTSGSAVRYHTWL